MSVCPRTLNASFTMTSIMSLLVVFVWACSLPPGRPTDPKTTIEQTLISEAFEKSADKASIDLPPGTAIFVEATGLTQDHPYVGHVIEGWLGRQGLNICRTKEVATHRARVIVQSIGPSQNTKIFGIPGGGANTGKHVHTTEHYSKAVSHKDYTVFFFITWQKTSVEEFPD